MFLSYNIEKGLGIVSLRTIFNDLGSKYLELL